MAQEVLRRCWSRNFSPMDRRFIILCVALAIAITTHAQLAVNPQLGVNFTHLASTPNSLVSRTALGWQLGADLRVGKRFYFQPGAFFGRSVTVIAFSAADTSLVEDNLVRTTAKLKALAGFNLIDGEVVRLRVNAGPTYDALLSVDHTEDRIAFNRKDYASGSFNMDGGVGLDLWIITAEAGVSYGLSKAYTDSGVLRGDAKYFTWYFNLGMVFGGHSGR